MITPKDTKNLIKEKFAAPIKLETNALLRQSGLLYDIGKREVECILRHFNYYFNPTNVNTSPRAKDDFIVSQINSKPDRQSYCNYLIQIIESNLIILDDFKNLEIDNHRQTLHLISSTLTQPIQFYTNDMFECFIYNLDALPVEISYKYNIVNSSLMNFNTRKLTSKKLKWLNKDNSKQIEWALEYVQKNPKIYLPPFFSVSNDQQYQYIVAHLDRMMTESPEVLELYLLKMKKTWSQKKFRDSGKAKKLYHLPLSETTKQKLEKIAEFNNTNQATILERLINYEFEKLPF
ncbi:hypothetical protein BS636_01660 [Acinetobacter sp. LoGeW2-3]|uniref:hypothetical protein n=1 Tax=Acinetobacter sp. LoGeW2-3 TaxID=1808001 RepID=UPI000C058324|nr:hypothetical protein [Acinetobacter sp. LoGeW2-3]ATO18467.1 hypothetical protein BS636_01660 [Acinetobacter sp. LoGeW2-3]